MVELSSKYPNLIHLNLSHNNLTEFPSSLLKCENIISLDIRKNNFEDVNIFNNLI